MFGVTVVQHHTEPAERHPVPPVGGASRMLRGLMLRVKKFLFFTLFKISVNIFVHNETKKCDN